MFKDAGNQIKTAAAVIFTLSIFGAVAVFLYTGNFLLVILCILGAWMSAIMMYGFGEIVDKITQIEGHLDDIRRSVSNVSFTMQSDRKDQEEDQTNSHNE